MVYRRHNAKTWVESSGSEITRRIISVRSIGTISSSECKIQNVARAIKIGGANSNMWKPRHKFNAIRTEEDGIKFPSKLEAKYYEHFKLKRMAGEVLFFLRQVPFHLVGGVRYVCDFLLFNSDGSCDFVEVKGFDTAMSKMKRKMVEAEYGVEIKVVR